MLRRKSGILINLSNKYHGGGRPTLASVEAIERENTVPSHARVVICGGGLIGSSVAYHLAELGWGTDTVVIEKGR